MAILSVSSEAQTASMRFRRRSRRSLVLAAVIICAGCTPRSGQTGTLTEPSVVSPVPIPPDFVWRSAAELGAWASNAVSRGTALVVEDGTAFIRTRLGPGSFTLRSPDLPADSPPIRDVRIVYRWQPSEARHPLNVFLGIAVPWQKQYADDRALLAFGLDAPAWTTARASPISSPGLPFVAQYIYFTAEETVTPGVLDIARIELTR